VFARRQARAHGKNTGMWVTKFNLKYKVTGSIYSINIGSVHILQRGFVEQSRKGVDAIVLGTIQPASCFPKYSATLSNRRSMAADLSTRNHGFKTNNPGHKCWNSSRQMTSPSASIKTKAAKAHLSPPPINVDENLKKKNIDSSFRIASLFFFFLYYFY